MSRPCPPMVKLHPFISNEIELKFCIFFFIETKKAYIQEKYRRKEARIEDEQVNMIRNFMKGEGRGERKVKEVGVKCSLAGEAVTMPD